MSETPDTARLRQLLAEGIGLTRPESYALLDALDAAHAELAEERSDHEELFQNTGHQIGVLETENDRLTAELAAVRAATAEEIARAIEAMGGSMLYVGRHEAAAIVRAAARRGGSDD